MPEQDPEPGTPARRAEPAPEPRGPQHADGPIMTPADPAHRADLGVPQAPGSRPRHRRRVTTKPPAGSDPTPEPEKRRHAASENDDKLKRDKPPHWG